MPYTGDNTIVSCARDGKVNALLNKLITIELCSFVVLNLWLKGVEIYSVNERFRDHNTLSISADQR